MLRLLMAMEARHLARRLEDSSMRASTITPQAVHWLWWPYLPLGKITAAAGQMGQAKSLMTVWLAAAASNGEGLTLGRACDVIMLNAEDDREDTIAPRLRAAGANLDRVWLEPDVSLNVDHLSDVCDELGDVRLIVVDPMQAFLPSGVNSWKGQDVRLALEPLRQLAADRYLSVLLVQHLNRRTDAGDPLARIADSQGIPQLARSVLIWGPDPADPEGDHGSMKVLTKAKGNLARSKASAMFTIEEREIPTKTKTLPIKAPVLVRGADREITADDVIIDHETRTAIDEAVEWLRDLLADGPVPAKDGQRKAREVGIAERTLKRAKRVAGVISESSRSESQISSWHWKLEVPIYTCGPLGTVGTVGPLGLSKGAKGAKEANNANGNNGHATDAETQAWAEGLLSRYPHLRGAA
jgi:AAA domain